jgi:hypothetical protein
MATRRFYIFNKIVCFLSDAIGPDKGSCKAFIKDHVNADSLTSHLNPFFTVDKFESMSTANHLTYVSYGNGSIAWYAVLFFLDFFIALWLFVEHTLSLEMHLTFSLKLSPG